MSTGISPSAMPQSIYPHDFERASDTMRYYTSPSSLHDTSYPSPPPITSLPLTRSPSLTSSSSMSHSSMSHSASSGHSPDAVSTPLPYPSYDLDRSHKMLSEYPQDLPQSHVQILDYDQGYRTYPAPHELYSPTSGPILDRFTRHSDMNPYYTTSPLVAVPPRSHTHPSLYPYTHERPHPYANTARFTYQVPSQAYPVVYTDNASVKLTDRIRRKCHNCQSTATSTWRRSSLSPGKVLCNKCGLFERTHSVARPRNKPAKGALSAGR